VILKLELSPSITPGSRLSRRTTIKAVVRPQCAQLHGPALVKGPRVLEQECSLGHVNPFHKPRRHPIQVHRREPDPVWEGMNAIWNILGTMSRVIFGVGNLICGTEFVAHPSRPAKRRGHLVLEFSGMFGLFREELPVPVLADRDGVGLSDRSHLGPWCPFLSSITLQ
jgi:hypothetical protein